LFQTKHNLPPPTPSLTHTIAKIALWIMASTSAIEWGAKKNPHLFISMIHLSNKKMYYK
jgi:type IV secretory pathway TrbD component